MTNLRARVQKFDPFRSIQPVGGGGGDTYRAPDTDYSRARDLGAILDAFRDLSPSVKRFADQSHANFLRETQTEAEGLVAEMSPEEIRRESERAWEEHSKASGIDNAWWQIALQEAAGDRLGVDLAERLNKRLLEASDPNDPQAHFRILQEERDAASAGLNSFGMARFNATAKNISAKWILDVADRREQRFQSTLADSFQHTVRGKVAEALDPARGGEVDLAGLMEAVEGERQRSGNDGRGQVLKAVSDALTIKVQQADTAEELDAVRVQASALLASLGEQAFGEDGQPLEETHGIELDALQEKAEADLEQRERLLRSRGDESRADALEAMNDFATGLSAQVFGGSKSRAEAQAELEAKAQEFAEQYGQDAATIYGNGLRTFQTGTATLQGTRYPQQSNPETVHALNEYWASGEWDQAAGLEMLAGAVERGEVSAAEHSSFLSKFSDARTRAVEAQAAGPVGTAFEPLSGRLTNTALGPWLETVLDPGEQDEVAAWTAAELRRREIAERGRLAAAIAKAGPENAQAAIDEWQVGFAERSSAMLREVAEAARERFGDRVSSDPEEAWTRAVRGSRDYEPAEQRFLYDWIQEEFAGREQEAEVLLSDIHGGQIVVTENPVGDLAAIVAREGDRLLSGDALDIYRRGSTAFLDTLREGQEFDGEAFDVRKAVSATEAKMRGLRVAAPKERPRPTASAPPDPDAKGKVLAAAGSKAAEATAAAEQVAKAQARSQAARDQGFPADIQAEADRELEKIQAEQQRIQRLAFAEHQRVLDRVAAGMRPDIGKPLYGGLASRRAYDPITNKNAAGEGLEIRNGRLHLSQPPMKSRATYLGFGPVVRSVDTARYEELVREIEGQFVAAKSYLGLTLEEVKAGKASPFEGAPPDKWINLDRGLVSPASTPFFKSVAELEAADLTEWLGLFPAYSREMFVAAQRQIILERIPEAQ